MNPRINCFYSSVVGKIRSIARFEGSFLGLKALGKKCAMCFFFFVWDKFSKEESLLD